MRKRQVVIYDPVLHYKEEKAKSTGSYRDGKLFTSRLKNALESSNPYAYYSIKILPGVLNVTDEPKGDSYVISALRIPSFEVEEEEVERQKSYGISLSKFLRLKIGSEAKTREYIRKELETRISDLIQRLNWLIAEVEDKSSKKVVVVIDDLDKLTRGEQAEKFFYQNYSLLLLPDCFVVYTFPIPLAFNPYYENVRQAFDGSFILPQPPIVDREEKLIEENFEFYRKIAEKRMNLNLIDDIAMKEAILSTGKLSEFILIIREAAIKAYRNGREKITLDEIEAALEKLRRTYDRTLTERHKRRLVEIYEKKDARDRDEKDSISRDLLFSLTAVEYEDEDGRWCDINPILKPLLEKWKKEA